MENEFSNRLNNWLDESLVENLSKLKLGRKAGRPRKFKKFLSFFDYSCKSKGNFRYNQRANTRRRGKQTNVGKPRKKNNVTSKEVVSTQEGQAATDSTSKDMAVQVLETGLLMGLIENQDRESSLALIRNKLQQGEIAIHSELPFNG